MEAIRIFITGGTFDKEYDEINGSLYFNATHLPEMLTLGRSRCPTRFETLMMKDSLDITEDERKLITTKCQNAVEKRIIITHGTDTMVDTARMLGEAKIKKTIILTGAMIPYKFGSSDGLFNLGGAIAFAQSLDHGVYVAMQGLYFKWDNVRKNKELGIFESLA